ncbi:dihydrodipicolinate synthase family protein [Tuwongella immobilis]|uniref:5-dehydro-4-deoxyglucarate dehydratase n=1 Tax=Tuwongella immobilis TaxID=692036 RepID=A0A6C2YIE0_9BACT|nr:dihydrodipicolinate synthase family protein [Tuwongella immobilis]VIP01134.1 dihydrodipicolinate synthase : Dihydrodipicolinate synthase OS=Planctomyces maris DSM 8797 GN=PM8797T_18199 PE=3 SV=1: DHDPS [Tuwongella immobilis]VTR97693.1 dihydrodipicolinate synthase : Dihydrodipicolinate synthase OS=Planctomyces maris DSM 8797 GN=PM8797T_18199 PE=3 SV=1: DHDPS [Tuwongella immobilis]
MSRNWDFSRLDTVQLVPPTPFTPDGRGIRPEVLLELVQRRAAEGIRVFLPAAGTGEFHSLSALEVLACVSMTRMGAPNAVVLAPVGGALGHACEIASQAAGHGADALLLMPPVHPYLCDAGFRDYFQAIAAMTDLPIVAYKRGPVPSEALLLDLGRIGRLVGVKYAVNEMDAFRRFVTKATGLLGIYCGTAERFAPFMMLAGATGYTTGAGNLVPRITLAMHAALVAGDSGEALRLLDILRPIEDYRARDGESYNISLIKYAVNHLGFDMGPVRPPQRQLTSNEQAEIAALLQPILAVEQAMP